MSPCFEYYIDIDRAEDQFVIRDTMTSTIIDVIPKDLMNPKLENPKEVMNRFEWIDKNTIRMINKEGVEKIVDIQNDCSEVEYNVIPLFNNEEIKNPLRHYFTNRTPLNINEVLQRLQRKYQNYKSAYYLEHKREPFSLYSELFTVDYQRNGCKGMHSADMSFTFLHWKMMEQLDLSTLSIDLIDDEQIQLLCYNILPGGDTILHKLHNHNEIISKIFETAQPNEEQLYNMKF